MVYSNTVTGTFLSRPNRFLAHVMVGGHEVVCHVKNTGRLKELLIPGVPVVVQFHPEAAALGRKTEYSLIGVAKPGNHTWVNIDSQAPNQAAYEWLTNMSVPGILQHPSAKANMELSVSLRPQNIRREVRYGDSRFDLSFTDEGRPWFMEVKGVTLDMNGTAMFPDAPTERGIKHLDELGNAAGEGYGAAVLFVIQMKGIAAFTPHRERHPEFADALLRAKHNGVYVWAYDCVVTKDTLQIDQPVQVLL